MEGTIADVRCLSCGAPAKYDVIRQSYVCAFCGGQVELSQAQAQKRGFRQLQQEKIRRSAEAFHLLRANCTGCGAELVFEEQEAQTSCAFCGRALVRRDYAVSEEMPEMILPFRLTEGEARDCLREWCRANPRREEAKHLLPLADKLRGFYLPYELIRGPVKSRVSRMDAKRVYNCEGYVDDVFVNASRQLVTEMKKISSVPVWVKVTPSTTDPVGVASVCAEAGADAVVATNTIPAMKIDITRCRPVLGNKTGGLSGPAMFPASLRIAYMIHRALPELPIVGCGGVDCGEKAVQYILAGCSAVEIGTATFRRPDTLTEVKQFLENYMDRMGFKTVDDFRGLAAR